ncbi:MAG TPA: IPT/TIG domain-containing protein [Solirubrobacteraceae bacterium]|nr:IPT/TIG domain-containing protein [Solirubrobacteraceae bacterium]
MAAASASACSRPADSIWTGTAGGPQTSLSFESSVTVSAETFPGSETAELGGKTAASGTYTVSGHPYPMTLSGSYNGTVTCAGAESFSAEGTLSINGSSPIPFKTQYVGNANYTEASGTYRTEAGGNSEEGVWSATFYATVQSVGSQPGNVVLVNPSNTSATSLSAQPSTGLPGGEVTAPVGELSYGITEVTPGATIDVSFKLPAGSQPTGFYKRTAGGLDPYPASKTKVNGEEITLEITDNGPWDENPTLGAIQDPIVPVHQAAPAVTGLSLKSGPSTGGSAVTITGTGFLGVSAVKFGAAEAMHVKATSDTSVTVESPPGTGAVVVTVSTPGGTSATHGKAAKHAKFKYKRAKK